MDKRKRPLGHCTTKRARQLIEKGRACVYRYYPFTIIIKDLDVRKIEVHHDYRIKPDPGAGYTGISIIEDDRVIAYFELQHRGSEIVDRLQTRRNSHRNRRSRETGYRRCKFPKNGVYETSREKGWLPPSQMSILNNVLNFVRRLEKLLGPCKISIELVKFDMQLLENLDIKGEDYQHVELYNYELKTYLLEKYQHTCQYCANETGDHRLEKEHMVPKSRGGSDSLKISSWHATPVTRKRQTARRRNGWTPSKQRKMQAIWTKNASSAWKKLLKERKSARSSGMRHGPIP